MTRYNIIIRAVHDKYRTLNQFDFGIIPENVEGV